MRGGARERWRYDVRVCPEILRRQLAGVVYPYDNAQTHLNRTRRIMASERNNRTSTSRSREGADRSSRRASGRATAAGTRSAARTGERAGSRASQRGSRRTSGFMRYAADNRVVQAVYQLTTGPARYAFYGLIVLAVAISVYFPVRDLYAAYRTGDILERQLEVRNDYNKGLEDDVDHLLSTEGIEDIAREDLGLVLPGEHAVTVTGIDPEDTDEEDAAGTSSEVEQAEQAAAEEAPWYIKLLDVVFFYQGVEGQTVASTGE